MMNTRKTALVLVSVILLAAGLGARGSIRYLPGIPGDADGDGVPDSVDACPGENASFFDRDGDGCIDDPASTRHTEFWVSADLPFVYYIQEDGAPSIGDGSDFAAVQNGIEAWASIPGTDFTVSYGGTVARHSADAMDLINMVTFRDSEFPFPSSVLAVGISTSFTVDTTYNSVYYRPGQIFDADMIFNPAMDFRTPTAGISGLDIQSIATHEAGHMFGIAHSAVRSSTMFFVLPSGTEAASLETEDKLAFFKAYSSPAALAAANRIAGRVVHGLTGEGIGGAAVFAIDAAGGDTVACEYTFSDGSWSFAGMADGNYYVAVHPIDGTSSMGYLRPCYINTLVDSIAVDLFPPEYWDLAESSSDDASAKDPLTVSGGSTASGIEVITNLDTTPPSVVSMTPATGVTGVLVNAVVKIRFDEPVDYTTIPGNFRLLDGDSTFITGSAAVLDDDSVLAFTPGAALLYSTRYDLTLGTGLKDKYGNGLAAEFVSYFTTEPVPALAIMNLSPSRGVAGSIAVISGVGFNPVPSLNDVYFGALPALVTDASPTRLVVTVPDGAGTGLVTVFNGVETSNGLTFTVLASGEIVRGFQTGAAQLGAVPRSVKVHAGGSYAYAATSAGASAVVIDAEDAGYLSVESIPVEGGLGDIALTPGGARAYGVNRLNRKIYVIDTDPAHAGLFNQVLYEIDADAGPTGIAIDPGGEKAYVPTDKNVIQIWDIQAGSGTLDEQIGAIIPVEASLRGKLAVDPSGRMLAALTGTGRMLVYDLGPDTLLASIPAGSDPRDLVIDPTGQRAYVSGGDGNVTVVSLAGLFKVQDIYTGGHLRGTAIAPTGKYLYVANRELNLIDVIDLDESRSTFRSVAATLAQDPQPVDLDFSNEGDYAFSVIESSRQLVVTAIGLGPTLRSMSRRAAVPGSKVVLAGDGFGTVTGDLDVRFAGPAGSPVLVEPEHATGTSIVVTVPDSAASGPVDVIYDPPAPPGEGRPAAQVSNPLYMKIMSSPAAHRVQRLAGVIDASPGWLLEQTIAIPPTGGIAVVGGMTGEMGIIDIDPGSPAYNQPVNTFDIAPGRIEDIAVTPDGKRAFTAIPSSPIRLVAYSIDRWSGEYGSRVGEVDLTGLGHYFYRIIRVETSPGGELLIAADFVKSLVLVVDIRPGSPTEYGVLAVFEQIRCSGIAFHPGGRYAYFTERSSSSVIVLDVDPLSATYLAQVASVEMPGYPDGGPLPTPQDLDFLPDGSECKVLTILFDQTRRRTVVTLDTSDPAVPVACPDVLERPAAGHLPIAPERIAVSPRGEMATVQIKSSGYWNIDLTADPDTIGSGYYDPSFKMTAEFAFTPDAAGLYSAGPYPDSVYFYDYAEAAAISIASGNLQAGVVDRMLAVPLRVLVTGSGGIPAEGVPVTFIAADGHFTGGLTVRVAVTDALGYASVDWVLGSAEGTQHVSASAQGLSGSPLVFEAIAFPDPDTMPLSVVRVRPVPFQTDVSVTTGLQVTFSKPVDPGTVTSGTFHLNVSGESVPLAALTGYSGGNRKVALMPYASLEYEEEYDLAYTSGILDAAGGALTNPGVSGFSTGVKTPINITSISPPSSAAGLNLTISGAGFEESPQDHRVLFNGAEAVPYESGTDYVKVKVPSGALPGYVKVSAAGVTSNALPFTVLVPSKSPVDEVLATVDIGVAGKSIAVTPDGSTAYAVSPDAGVVIPIDILGTYAYPGIPVGDLPAAIAMHPQGIYTYVANFGSGNISVIGADPDSAAVFNAVASTVQVGLNPLDLAVHPDGDRVYVVNAGSGDLSVIDSDVSSATYNAVVATIVTGSSSRSVTVMPDGTRIFVGTDTGFMIVDPLTNGITATVGTGSATKSVTVTPDGAYVILLTTEGEVLLIDVQPGSSTENAVVARVGAGSTAKSITVSPDGALLYIILDDSDYLIVYSIEVLGSIGALDPGTSYPPPEIQITLVDSILVGSSPADIAFDPSGSGTAVVTNAGDGTVTILNTSSVPSGPVAADVSVTPRMSEDGSGSRWIAASIRLPGIYFAGEVDLSSIMMQDLIHAQTDRWRIADDDLDGIDELTVYFDRLLFQEAMPQGNSVPVTIRGMVRGREFVGVDTIQTVRPTVTHPTACSLWPGSQVVVTWVSPAEYEIGHVDVLWSHDDGETWAPVVTGIPDNGSVIWITPLQAYDLCRMMVVLYDDSGVDIGMGMSPEPFSIVFPIAVSLASFRGEAGDGGALLKWETSVELHTTGFEILRSEEEYGEYEVITDEYVPSRGIPTGASYEYLDEDVSLNRAYYYMLKEISGEGSRLVFGPYKVEIRAVFSLSQNVPNPFNPLTKIRFTVPQDGPVNLAVYDVAGRRIKTLVDGHCRADFYSVTWDGTNDNGSRVASGVYFYCLTAGKHSMSRKLVLLR
jgi:DNA-binding beta-propeller fold protein YncE